MNEKQIYDLLNNIIDNSKYKNATPEQKEKIIQKILQKYLNDFNLTALEMLEETKRNEFSNLLASNNQTEIEKFINENISDIESLVKKTSEKFSNEIYLVLKD